jgi:type IV pilus assembly protein PilQ
MVGVLNSSGIKLLPISKGNTKSIRVVSTSEKTRAVIDLFKSAHHELSVTGNMLTVTVFGNKKSSNSLIKESYHVEDIDFRRGLDGQGKVIINFNKPGVIINLRETADKIKLVINNTDLPEAYDNKLDVTDFATPISFIDSRERNGNVTIEVSVNGNNEHLAYQTGSQYVLEVVEKVEVEDNDQAIIEEVVYVGNKVSFNFQDIPVRSVLQLIADASQLNLVVADTVQGSVTLRLNNVPWDQALDIVLNSKQLDKRRKDDVIWIAPAKEIADREEEKLKSLKVKEEFAPLKTIFIQVNYAKAGELSELLDNEESNSEEETGSILSARGSVTFDERTNILLVSDIPDRLLVVEEFIKALDVAVRQVQVETRIVVATDDFGDELGVRFGITGSKQDHNGNIISTGGSLEGLDRLNSASIFNRINSPSGTGVPNFTPGINGAPIIGPALGERLNVNLPSSSGAASKWAFSILAADYLLDLELSALESEGRGEVISTPRVVTTNQKEAKIKQGVQIPFEQATSSGATSITFKEAVLSLEVTPLITPDDRVDLTLKINKDSIGELVPTSLGGSIPTIDTRSIETRILVENGQTIVLGGIFEQVRRTDRSKVPVFGDIPGLGVLFRNKQIQNDKSELLIFVTPTIIKESL